jgi:tRNA threonylcarbamoyladenosine biosynthesis protein TsaB
MLILAFDTTSENGGVAIYRDGDCLAVVANQGPANVFSVTLFEMVDRLLVQARLDLRAIDLFGVANGPGSFTGIRVGLAAALAWAKAFDRPVQGISVLEAMVEAAQPQTAVAVPILDARRGEFYLSVFRRAPVGGGEPFQPEGEGWVLKPHALGAFLEGLVREGGAVTCLARQHDQVVQGLAESLPRSLKWQLVPGILVGPIARLALRAQREGKLQESSQLDAYYIRRPDAELNWRG